MDKQQLKQTIDDNITTNGQNEITGAKLNDVLNEMVDSLGVVNEISVGTTTTGAAGTNASVTNSGTTQAPALNFTIPRGADGQDGADAVNPFKGWYNSLAELKAAHTAIVGDSAYVKDASPATTWSIYVYDSTASSDNYWANSGSKADTSNVQTFASGEEVNQTYIDNTGLANPISNSLAKATDVMVLNETLDGVKAIVVKDGTTDIANYYIAFNVASGAYKGRPYHPSSHPERSSYRVINVDGYKKIRFLGMEYPAGNDRNAGYAFYDASNDGTQTDGTGLMFAYGYPNGVSSSAAEKEITVEIPQGAKWLFVTSKNTTIQHFYAYLIKGDDVISASERIANSVMIPSILDYSNYHVDYVISTGNKWITASGQSVGAIIPIESNKKYIIQPSENGLASKAVYAVLEDIDDFAVGTTPHWADGYSSRIALTSTDAVEVTMPSNAHYLYLLVSSLDGTQVDTKLSSDVLLTDAVIELQEKVDANNSSTSDDMQYNNVNRKFAAILGNPLTDVNKVYEDGWEQPTKVEILNVVKKSHQLTDIQWMPLRNVPKLGSGEVWAANTQVTGMPYSSVKEIDKYIGLDVSILTFMTAVNNPYSLLYTEFVHGNGTSDWGFTYNGTGNCGSYFGTVCSSFVAYSTGQVVQWPTEEDAWCAKYNFNIVKKFNQSPSAINVGDIYWKSGHNRLITGIQRDNLGNITNVKLAESSAAAAVGKKCREREFTFSQFEQMVAEDNAIFYTNIELYRNLYEKSPFVDIDGETPTPYAYNDDICTFAGDRATFREGELVVINYNLKGNTSTDYSAINVYKKNGNAYQLYATYQLSSIDQSQLPLDQQNHALKIANLEYGSYKAVLTDGINESDATLFEVLQTIVTCQNEGDTYTFGYASKNSKPISFTVSDIHGVVYAHNVLSDDAVEDGKLVINLVQFNKQQYPKRNLTSDLYLKIHFEGEYGRVTNIPVKIM